MRGKSQKWRAVLSHNKKNKIVLRFIEISEVICGLLGSIILIMCIIQVILRISFKIALPWVYETTSLLGVYFVYLGISTLVLRGTLARVNIFLEMMPKFLNIFFNIVISLSTISLGFALIVGGWNYKGTLSLYTMTNLPLSAEMFLYPIIVFGFALSFRGFISISQPLKIKNIDENMEKK